MAKEDPNFLVAEFTEPEAMLEAARTLIGDDWPVEIHTPFPVDGMAEALGFDERAVPAAVLIGGIVGTALGFAVQVLVNLVYPLDVGGRPLIALPAFVIVTLVVGILCAALAGLGTMLVKDRLPRLHYPLFDAERFHLASDDRFFVSVRYGENERDAAGKALARFEPASIAEVG